MYYVKMRTIRPESGPRTAAQAPPWNGRIVFRLPSLVSAEALARRLAKAGLLA